MLSINPKWIIAGVATAALALIITLSYRHYTGLVAENTALASSNAELSLALEVQGKTVTAQEDALREWQMAAEEAELLNIELQRVAQQATAETRRLNAIFAEHDLTRLSLAKPGLIERAINRGTADAFRMLECASDPGCSADSGNPET